MQDFLTRLPHSASIKVFIIGFLILVMLIPLSMIRGVIYERNQTGHAAKLDIQRTWGNPQFVAGPVLVVPYHRIHTNTDGGEIRIPGHMYLLPETLSIDGDIDPEVLYRGMHNVPVYTARVRFSGAFSSARLDEMNISVQHVDWKGVFVAVGISDGRAITKVPNLNLAGKDIRFESGGRPISGLPSQIVAPIGKSMSAEQLQSQIAFKFELNLNGSESLQFLPAGDTTNVSLRSSWPSPSFSGNYLPEIRNVSDDGFDATWRVASIGRTVPSRWTDTSGIGSSAHESAFGVELYMPISVYRLTERATKYGVLFVGLTFVAYFLFEVVAGLRLHPLQYLLVGFANSLFYLLLLSLAEHIGFGWSYTISCGASCALIIGYSLSVLGDRRRALIMAAILVLLYSFLYMTLKAEDYAMLAGAVGLWATLGVIMYLTRGINWYGKRDVPG